MTQTPVPPAAEMVIGIETEYGPASFDGAVTPMDVSRWVLEAARTQTAHLRDCGNGLFLASGGRLMIDNGAHLEYATPEAATPWDAVLAVRAGDAVLRTLLVPSPQFVLSRSNFCYAQRVTYGAHENYGLQRRDIMKTNDAIRAHLVSRIVFSGAGGLDPRGGLRFVLSPRALVMLPAIVCARNEPHAAAHGRLHVRFGDTLAVDQALLLKLGTTALLVRLAELGAIDDDRWPSPVDPAAAAERFARDPSLRARAVMRDATTLTAVQMQRRILAAVEHALAQHPDAAPPWAGPIVRRWRHAVAALESAPERLPLDWTLKRRLFELALEEHGCSRIEAARLLAGKAPGDALPVDVETLRRELAKIDFMFAALPRGLADDALARCRGPRVPGLTPQRIRAASRRAPAGTRAALRSRFIARHRHAPECYRVDWGVITHRFRPRSLVMDDPTREDAHWQRATTPRCLDLTALSDAYNRGDYRQLSALLEMASAHGPTSSLPLRAIPYRIWAASRTGKSAVAREILRSYLERDPRGGPEIGGLRVAVERFIGLRPPRNLIRLGEEIEAGGFDDWAQAGVKSFLGHYAYGLRCRARLDEAVTMLVRATNQDFPHGNQQRLVARNHCDLADCLRIIGAPAEAHRHLDAAREVYAQFGYDGEDADHRIPVLAKLTPDREEATEMLETAGALLSRRGLCVGVVRVNLLLARCALNPTTVSRARERCLALQERVPDLRRCPLLRRILLRWSQWTDRQFRHPVDPFWLV